MTPKAVQLMVCKFVVTSSMKVILKPNDLLTL